MSSEARRSGPLLSSPILMGEVPAQRAEGVPIFPNGQSLMESKTRIWRDDWVPVLSAKPRSAAQTPSRARYPPLTQRRKQDHNTPDLQPPYFSPPRRPNVRQRRYGGHLFSPPPSVKDPPKAEQGRWSASESKEGVSSSPSPRSAYGGRGRWSAVGGSEGVHSLVASGRVPCLRAAEAGSGCHANPVPGYESSKSSPT